MGYATIKRVPQVRSYEQALSIFSNSKPVRGRAVEIRPLGDRRDADTYWIRKNADAIELVLYKTPVITFTPDGEVSLFVDGYNSVSTHQFIGWVLGISVHGARRTTVLTINAEKFTLADSDKLRMRMGEDGNWSVLNPTQQWGWKLNRKEVTNVRTRYGEFYKYLKGFVNLRTEERQQHRWHPVKNYVVIQLDEFKSVFDGVIHLRDYKYMDKRGKQKINWTMVKREQYEASAKAFEYLIRPDQPEEGKHTNFYKAALILIAKQDTDEMDIRAEETFAMSKHIVPLLDDVLFMLYADQVLVQYQLAMGKVSSGIYEHWMVDWE
jgi:hypothetical protein